VFDGRLLSVRAYDADGMMRDAELPMAIRAHCSDRFFADGEVAYLHVHYAGAAVIPAASSVPDLSVIAASG